MAAEFPSAVMPRSPYAPRSPYMLASQTSTTPLLSSHGPLPSFSVAQTISNLSSSANNLAPSSAANPIGANPSSAFRAPAHKHAHHLHSIPPREKSTRTLIIDHLLWVHGRTRFAQARAELGMTDRTGGPSAASYVHRERPENFEEEEEAQSDGETVSVLKGKGGPGQFQPDDEEERANKQDLNLARSLRLRSEALEKVVTSMLDQPPTVHPNHDEDFPEPSTSPSLKPHSDASHPHTIPNGVRLRLALSTVINDLFSRQAPPPPFRHERGTTSSSNNTSMGPTPNESPVLSKNVAPVVEAAIPDISLSLLPPVLIPLSDISGASPLVTTASSTGQSPSAAVNSSPRPPNAMRQNGRPIASSHTRDIYTTGVDTRVTNSSPTFLCPRHLHAGCEICVEAKAGGRPAAGLSKGSTSGGAGDPSVRSSQRSGGGITGWQDGNGIGSGLARPGPGGSVLRRRSTTSPSHNKSSEPAKSGGAGNARLSEMIPRFLRLSALVATELGREAREGVDWEKEEDDRPQGAVPSSSPPSVRTVSSTSSATQERNRMYSFALRPSQEWYMLLAGLLTRAVLEGYLTAGWRGLDAVDCLLMVGQGIVDTGGIGSTEKGKAEYEDVPNRESHKDDDFEDDFEWFDPDELPSLKDAARLLFPALRNPKTAPLFRKDAPDAEFEQEMEERLRRFYDVPGSTPDLATHIEDLAWQYPAKPVERAAVRFCEAIAKWRGKPELETYKKNPPTSPQAPGSTMTIESLVHSNPTSPSNTTFDTVQMSIKSNRPSIERYFSQPLSIGSKRMRSPDESRVGAAMKKMHQ